VAVHGFQIGILIDQILGGGLRNLLRRSGPPPSAQCDFLSKFVVSALSGVLFAHLEGAREKPAVAVFPNDGILLPLGNVVRARFRAMKKDNGGSEDGTCRVNHEPAHTAGYKFFG
jgi:hypothetical protein